MSVREAQDLEARIRELGLLDPTDRRMRRHRPAPPLDTLRGKRAGFLDNRKGNADVILERVREVLAADHDLADTVMISKCIYSATAAEDILDTLEGSCDVVIISCGA